MLKRLLEIDVGKHKRYFLVSLLITSVDYTIFACVYFYTNAIIAQVISYLIAITMSFYLHGKYVYQINRQKHLALSAIVTFSLLGLIISSIILHAYIAILSNVFISTAY